MAKTRRKFLATLAICGAATLFQTGLVPQGCGQFFTQLALGVFDACSVLNCTSGTFFNFCDPIVTLVDCPDVVTTTP
ncbi:MAG: hypothetical protein D6744_07480 [Planctomycetota bacterium]|nr:MAG: hypothetical protein D6744_07480 [Planctomycetota bacterium]